MTQDARDDLADLAFHNDPHPFYAQWRQTGPVRPVVLPGGFGGWLVTRYEDARQALTDPRLSQAIQPPQVNDPRPAAGRDEGTGFLCPGADRRPAAAPGRRPPLGPDRGARPG